MKANEFVKKFGIDHTVYLLEDTELDEFAIYSNCAGKSHMDTVSVSDLKRLVESWELVESFGGLELAKKELQRQSILRWINPKTEALREAIADVESCQFKSAFKDDRTDFVSDIKNHISPTTVVIER